MELSKLSNRKLFSVAETWLYKSHCARKKTKLLLKVLWEKKSQAGKQKITVSARQELTVPMQGLRELGDGTARYSVRGGDLDPSWKTG